VPVPGGCPQEARLRHQSKRGNVGSHPAASPASLLEVSDVQSPIYDTTRGPPSQTSRQPISVQFRGRTTSRGLVSGSVYARKQMLNRVGHDVIPGGLNSLTARAGQVVGVPPMARCNLLETAASTGDADGKGRQSGRPSVSHGTVYQTIARAFCAMSSAVSWNSFMSSQGIPDSPNVSCTPICAILRGLVWVVRFAAIPATMLPKPPT